MLVFDTADFSTFDEITVGANPSRLALTQDGALAYVVNHGGNSVSVINTTTDPMEVIDVVDVGSQPFGLAITRDGTRVYVADAGPYPGTGTSVSVIDTASNSFDPPFAVESHPVEVVVTADGAHIYVSHPEAGTVSIVDTSTGVPTGSRFIGGIPWGLAIGPIPVIEVDIDIKPGSDPNSISPSSAGVIPVGVFSSTEFDATTIDPETVALARARVKLVGKAGKYLCNEEDINGDDLDDLVCKVHTAQFMIEVGDSLAVLEAETYDGKRVRGEDTVRIVPNQ